MFISIRYTYSGLNPTKNVLLYNFVKIYIFTSTISKFCGIFLAGLNSKMNVLQCVTPKCPNFFNKKRWKSGTLWEHLPKIHNFWTIIKHN